MLAASLPKVVMSEPKITGQGDEYTVELSIENQGVIPTALRQAQLVKIVRPDSVSMVFPAGMISTQAMGGRGGRGAAAISRTWEAAEAGVAAAEKALSRNSRPQTRTR